MAEFWSTILQHASGGRRSDALRALIWPIGLIIAALVYGASRQIPMFILLMLSGFLVIFLLLYAGAYVFFAKVDPNLLRSESYNIEKMRIEHGVYGDSLNGITTVDQSKKLIEAQTKPDEQQ